MDGAWSTALIVHHHVELPLFPVWAPSLLARFPSIRIILTLVKKELLIGLEESLSGLRLLLHQTSNNSWHGQGSTCTEPCSHHIYCKINATALSFPVSRDICNLAVTKFDMAGTAKIVFFFRVEFAASAANPANPCTVEF